MIKVKRGAYILAGVAFTLTLTGCGHTVPRPHPYVRAMQENDAGWQSLQDRLQTIDKLALSDAQKADARARLRILADHSVSVDDYLDKVDSVNQKNRDMSQGYGWINGLVAGCGSFLATIDKNRDWGPTSGAIGAGWALLGVTLDKAFVERRISQGEVVREQASGMRELALAVKAAWEQLANASQADLSARYKAWASAANAADNKATEILKIEALFLMK
jgi:hypothetical protein